MIAESLIGFVLGYLSGLIAGVTAAIVLFLWGRPGKSTTSLPWQTGADIVNQTWPPYLSNITGEKPESMFGKSHGTIEFENVTMGYHITKEYKDAKVVPFPEQKLQDGNINSRENG